MNESHILKKYSIAAYTLGSILIMWSGLTIGLWIILGPQLPHITTNLVDITNAAIFYSTIVSTVLWVILSIAIVFVVRKYNQKIKEFDGDASNVSTNNSDSEALNEKEKAPTVNINVSNPITATSHTQQRPMPPMGPPGMPPRPMGPPGTGPRPMGPQNAGPRPMGPPGAGPRPMGPPGPRPMGPPRK